MFDRLKNYINPEELEIHIYSKGIYIFNYISIGNFSDSNIIINCKYNNVNITGNKLVISRLKKDELYICGNIKGIVFNEK